MKSRLLSALLLALGATGLGSRALYGGSHNLLSYTLPRFGIETTFVDPRSPQAFAAAIRPETRLLFAETLCFVLTLSGVEFTEAWASTMSAVDDEFAVPFGATVRPDWPTSSP